MRGEVLHMNPADHASVRLIRRRFSALNQDRLRRVRDSLPASQRVFLDLLPLLFHLNNNLLPGHTGKKAPAGISSYLPSRHVIDTARKHFKGFNYRKRALRKYPINAIYLMGSSGSIAHNDKSDLDIWICHGRDLKEAQINALREKCDAISAWAAGLGLQVSFFTMEPVAFHGGRNPGLTADSSGSAQHHLLLEEFYRTALLIAGRHPAWWLVPPDQEFRYDDYLSDLVKRRIVSEHEYVDFGDLTDIPAGEFFGASLWQLHKAVDSPYKSVLKLLLIESYASRYPRPELLCTAYKRAVYDGVTSLEQLDPYVLMLRQVEHYLQACNEPNRIDIVRKCFYFKVNYPLSRDPAPDSYRSRVLKQLVRNWGWSRDHLLLLDSRPGWKINRVTEERAALVDELTRSYQRLSRFAREHAAATTINSTDLTLLGRRLYAAFERRAGKIDIINPGISTDLTESSVHFTCTVNNGAESWRLYRSDPEQPGVITGKPLKRASGLLELVAWAYFNRLLGRHTLVTLGDSPSVEARELLSIIDSFMRKFPDPNLPRLRMTSLRVPARLTDCALYVNIGIDPMQEHTRQGVHLISNRSDALSYGGVWKNLALQFDFLALTSWREILTMRFAGPNALIDCLCDYLAWAPLADRCPPPPVSVFSFTSTRNMAIAHRVQELFTDIVDAFYTNPWHDTLRYVLRIEHAYYVLQNENGSPRHTRLENTERLIAHLGQPQDAFSPVIFDRYASDDPLLAAIMAQNIPDTIQLFFLTHGDMAEVYIIDELGSLFRQTVGYHDTRSLISHYHRFLEATCRRIMSGHRELDMDHHIAIQINRITRPGRSQVHIERLEGPHDDRNTHYIDIQVIGESSGEQTDTMTTLYCNGHEISSLEYGDDVYIEAARYILALRSKGETYPIYITDLDVTPRLLGVAHHERLQGIHYLHYKARIERLLNDAMQMC